MATSSDVLHAINVGSNVGDDFACNTYSGRKRPPVNRNGWRPSCSHSTLRAIRYRALLHRWAFCPLEGIGKVGDAQHVEMLTGYLSDNAHIVMLGPSLFPAGTDFTLPLVSGGLQPLSVIAAGGLARIATPAATAAVREWVLMLLSDRNRYGAGETLQHVGVPLLPILVSMLESESREVQSKLAMPAAGLFLRDSDNLDSALRAFFANHRLLAPMIEIFKARYAMSPAAYGDLLNIFRSGGPVIQEQAVIAIGRIGNMTTDRPCEAANSSILPALSELILKNEDQRVRLVGVYTLEAFNTVDTAKVLSQLSQADPELENRKVAADAMARVLARRKGNIAERQ